MRKQLEFEIKDPISLESIVSFFKNIEPCIILNSNSEKQIQRDNYSCYDMLIAAGKIDEIPLSNNFFDELKKFHSGEPDWLFGYISYDVKNQVEKLKSENFDGVKALPYYFFRPRLVLEFTGKILRVSYDNRFDDEKNIRQTINSLFNSNRILPEKSNVNVQSRISRSEYLEKVNSIKKHIQRGDIYEINFCVEYFAEHAKIDPESVYCLLNEISPMPFSAFFKNSKRFLMCASPERFLAKRRNKLISQPIKGTVRRGKNEEEDQILKSGLRNNPKEQSENVMIVDLLRNDLSRTAKKGSVAVEELYGIKSFRQLHQMVSTVTSELNEKIHFAEAIKNAFPMGSMTGAPKIRAMELIEEYESTLRGIYSGAIGYITPNGDFDFNVVIRSILYNADSNYLSFMAGSAITDGSDPEKEYEEILLKAGSMIRVLSSQ